MRISVTHAAQPVERTAAANDNEDLVASAQADFRRAFMAMTMAARRPSRRRRKAPSMPVAGERG